MKKYTSKKDAVGALRQLCRLVEWLIMDAHKGNIQVDDKEYDVYNRHDTDKVYSKVADILEIDP